MANPYRKDLREGERLGTARRPDVDTSGTLSGPRRHVGPASEQTPATGPAREDPSMDGGPAAMPIAESAPAPRAEQVMPWKKSRAALAKAGE